MGREYLYKISERIHNPGLLARSILFHPNYLRTKDGIPVSLLSAKQKGPFLGLIAGEHGDEVIPIKLLIDFIHDTVVENRLSRGVISAIHIANPEAAALDSRTDKKGDDLNRKYPKTHRNKIINIFQNIFEKKTQTKLLAKSLLNYLVRQYEFNKQKILNAKENNEEINFGGIVALHDEVEEALPYVIVDNIPVNTSDETQRFSMRMAISTGLPVTMDHTDPSIGLDGSLTYVLVNDKRIPAITIEAGATKSAINRGDSFSFAQTALNNIASKMGVMKSSNFNAIPIGLPVDQLYRLKYTNIISNANLSKNRISQGSVSFVKQPGEIVKKGDIIAVLSVPKVGAQEDINLIATEDGILLSSPPLDFTYHSLNGEDISVLIAQQETDSRLVKMFNEEKREKLGL